MPVWKTGPRSQSTILWFFPASVVILMGVIYFTGGAEITQELVRQRLVEEYGLSEARVDRLSFRLPGGWEPSSLATFKSPPHEHDLSG